VDQEIGEGLLSAVIPAGAPLAPYCFVTRRDRWDDPVVARFRRWLLAALRPLPG
jgi:DNA-binding transcriptional LysR family regulator